MYVDDKNYQCCYCVYDRQTTSTVATFVVWVADWFVLMNDKMGGDLVKDTIVGKYLSFEVWKAAGMDLIQCWI